MRPRFWQFASLTSLLIVCLSDVGLSDGLNLELKSFGNTPAQAWHKWSPREEISPRFFVDSATFRSAPDALGISGDANPAAYGGWVYSVDGVTGGRFYSLTAYWRSEGIEDPRRQLLARIDWTDGTSRVGQPDYVYRTEPSGDGWHKMALVVPAPASAKGAKIELLLGWAPKGTVWWDDISFQEVAQPPGKKVRVGAVSLRPRNMPTKEASVQAFLDTLDRIALQKPDIVCLGEGITIVGNPGTYASVAEPIPGPTTDKLGGKARQHGMYIVAGLYEREGSAIYNTAVLIDRVGRVAGKYRKVHLPREETEGGLTPGNHLPVFRTDFGTIGMMICWDSQFTDPAKALAAQGAEIIFLPIWGGNYTLMKARAAENHVYLVSAGYDVETSILDPKGEVLYATKEPGAFKTVEIDLNERLLDPWLGDMRGRFYKEFRWDEPVGN